MKRVRNLCHFTLTYSLLFWLRLHFFGFFSSPHYSIPHSYFYKYIFSLSLYIYIYISFFLSLPPAVGKSALLTRLSENTFLESYTSTIGIDFNSRMIRVDRAICKLEIWDTAGEFLCNFSNIMHFVAFSFINLL